MKCLITVLLGLLTICFHQLNATEVTPTLWREDFGAGYNSSSYVIEGGAFVNQGRLQLVTESLPVGNPGRIRTQQPFNIERFTATFRFYISGQGADGLVFFWYPDADPDFEGGTGNGWDIDGDETAGAGIEIDEYFFGGEDPQVAFYPHIGIINHGPQHHVAVAPFTPDDNWHDVQVSKFDSFVQVFFDGNAVCSAIVPVEFNAGYLFFAAAFGSGRNDHWIDDIEIITADTLSIVPSLIANYSFNQDTVLQVLADDLLDSVETVKLFYGTDTMQVFDSLDLSYISNYNYEVLLPGTELDVDSLFYYFEATTVSEGRTPVRKKRTRRAEMRVMYQLKDPVFEQPFKFGEDNWSFLNSRPFLWERFWQPDLYLPEDRTVGQPYNVRYVNWDSFTAIFGLAQTSCWDPATSSLQMRQTARAWWLSNCHRWHGSCFGMSMTALTCFMDPTFAGTNLSVPVPYQTEVSNDYLFNLAEREIHRRQWWQSSPDVKRWRADNYRPERAEFVQRVREMFTNNTEPKRTLYISNIGISGPDGANSWAHAILPIRLRMKSSHKWELDCYDPNNGNSSGEGPAAMLTISIDVTGDPWWNLNSPAYQGVHAPAMMFLDGSPGAYENEPYMAWTDGATFRENLPPAGQFDLYVTDSIFTITNSIGDQSGYGYSGIFSEISDAYPNIPVTGYPTPPAGWTLPPEMYDIVVGDEYAIDNDTDPERIVIMQPGITFSAMRKSPWVQGAWTSHYQFDENNFALVLLNDVGAAAAKHYDVEVIRTNGSAEKTVSIEDLMLREAAQVTVTQTVDYVTLENYGDSTSARLHLIQLDDSVYHEFVGNNIPIADQSRLYFDVNWENTSSPQRILLDRGMNGSVDDTLWAQNDTFPTPVCQLPVVVVPVQGLDTTLQTSGQFDLISSYGGCTPDTLTPTAYDWVMKLTIATPETVTVRANSWDDLVLMLFTDCVNPNSSCLAYANQRGGGACQFAVSAERLTNLPLDPGEYYIAVGANTANGYCDSPVRLRVLFGEQPLECELLTISAPAFLGMDTTLQLSSFPDQIASFGGGCVAESVPTMFPDAIVNLTITEPETLTVRAGSRMDLMLMLFTDCLSPEESCIAFANEHGGVCIYRSLDERLVNVPLLPGNYYLGISSLGTGFCDLPVHLQLERGWEASPCPLNFEDFPAVESGGVGTNADLWPDQIDQSQLLCGPGSVMYESDVIYRIRLAQPAIVSMTAVATSDNQWTDPMIYVFTDCYDPLGSGIVCANAHPPVPCSSYQFERLDSVSLSAGTSFVAIMSGNELCPGFWWSIWLELTSNVPLNLIPEPKAPEQLTICRDGTGGMKISWMPVTENTDGQEISVCTYHVYGSATSDLSSPILIGSTSDTTFVDTSSPGISAVYFYQVRAVQCP